MVPAPRSAAGTHPTGAVAAVDRTVGADDQFGRCADRVDDAAGRGHRCGPELRHTRLRLGIITAVLLAAPFVLVTLHRRSTASARRPGAGAPGG